jgi:hypothetical protein
MSQTKFNVGDLVTVGEGKKVAKIIYTDAWDYCKFKFLISGAVQAGYKSWLKPYKGPIENIENIEDKKTMTLYSFPKADGSTGYGAHIGTNSQNKYLIEEKASGEIHVLDKEKLEEVLPYTYSVRYNTGSEYDFIGEPGTVAKGDILIQFTSSNSSAIQLVQVTNVDTKSRKATKRFNGLKVLTQPI